MAPIPEKDAIAIHNAIQSSAESVNVSFQTKPLNVEIKGSTGGTKLRCIKLGAITAMEQNTAKPSKWTALAKEGRKITWFVTAIPSHWGRIIDGKVDQFGKTIDPSGAASSSAASAPKAGAKATAKVAAAAAPAMAAAAMKKPAAAALEKGKAEDAMEVGDEDAVEEEEVKPPPAKKAKVAAAKPAAAPTAPGPKAKAKASPAGSSTASATANSSGSTTAGAGGGGAASSAGDDPLGLASLFQGGGHGGAWEAILRPVIEKLPNAAQFIGPSRSKRMVPVRELTFQALKPNPPSGWKVISFGQSPFPRIESATGIAHFDNAVSSWKDARFGAVMTMRCIIKAAAMQKYKVPKETSTQGLRALMAEHDVVGPAEWFQAMLTQGILFMNAACTLLPSEDKAVRAGSIVRDHTNFWRPVIEAVVKAILEECKANSVGVVFTWWGAESLETKKSLARSCFSKFPDVNIRHIDHKNPAAMGDIFCNEPNIFETINKELRSLGRGEIDWLPSVGWKDKFGGAEGTASADAMGDFIAETQALHKMYLERLKDGLDNNIDELADIVGIGEQPLVTLGTALGPPLKLAPAAASSFKKAEGMEKGPLSVDEAASVHMYTTNHLYKALNASLRDKNRSKVKEYFRYLRLLLTALKKLPASSKMLYRGVALDLSKEYPKGSEVTWWAVSSCTPDMKVAKSFGGGSKAWTLFVIQPASSVGIRHLSEYKHEEEFVLAPGTQFKVTDVKREKNRIEVHMKELEGNKRVR